MKIAIISYRYPPDIGGIETVSRMIAEEALKNDHSVRIVTHTKANESSDPAIPMVGPMPRKTWIETLRWCDLVIQNNISVGLAWPAWVLRKPQIIIHQTWIYPPRGKMTPVARMKRLLASWTQQIAISQPIADQWLGCEQIAGNPYDSDIYTDRGQPRDKDLIFVGRLVEGKGVMVLLESLKIMRDQGRRPSLTIVGDGPELERLKTFADLQLSGGQVTFVGSKAPKEIAALLNRHTTLVVPSSWEEPFGIVALEGAACGCGVVATDRGGLPDAAGPGALYTANGNVFGLAGRLEEALASPALQMAMKSASLAHAVKFGKREYFRRLIASYTDQ